MPTVTAYRQMATACSLAFVGLFANAVVTASESKVYIWMNMLTSVKGSEAFIKMDERTTKPIISVGDAPLWCSRASDSTVLALKTFERQYLKQLPAGRDEMVTTRSPKLESSPRPNEGCTSIRSLPRGIRGTR